MSAFTGATKVIPFNGDGYHNLGGTFYPNDTAVSSPSVNQGFPSDQFGANNLSISANALGRLYHYYDYETDFSDNANIDNDTVNTDVIFRDVSLDNVSPHNDLYVTQLITGQFNNFSAGAPDFASHGYALILNSPPTVAAKLELDFATTVQRVGMFFNGNNGTTQSFYTMDVFDINDLLIGQTTVGDNVPPNQGNAGFIGWEDLVTPISRVVVRETDALGVNVNTNASPFFDDVRYELFEVTEPPVAIEIPEPSTLLLASFGLLGLAARRVRKSR